MRAARPAARLPPPPPPRGACRPSNALIPLSLSCRRLAFTSSCRRLRALRDSSTRLWASLRVMGDKPTHSQLPVFLARGPKHVRELVLCAHVKLEGLYPEEVEEQGKLPVYDPAVIQVQHLPSRHWLPPMPACCPQPGAHSFAPAFAHLACRQWLAPQLASRAALGTRSNPQLIQFAGHAYLSVPCGQPPGYTGAAVAWGAGGEPAWHCHVARASMLVSCVS